MCRLLESGWLVFASVRRETDGSALRADLNDHPRLHTLLVDISDERQVQTAAAEVQSELSRRAGRLCAIVCNAGYAGQTDEQPSKRLLTSAFAARPGLTDYSVE